ncbi:MAG TPA: 50S ribosomal protein L25 [Bryobacteraceae bacterium]|jgi:large subunit ribosomal protein L25|nr:50S ribosomal protein L25 [Bryobacteraceae bacterium]
MKTEITVTAEARASRGKNEARRTRRAGLIPAVVYGAFKDPVPIAVSPKQIAQILHSKTGHNTIFNLSIKDGESAAVMVVDGQHDPIKGHLLHVDLKRIDLSKRIRVSVPIIVQGEPKGVKQQGGLLESITREVEIECLPNEIPENFTIDVGELLIGQSKRASDLALSDSVKLISSPDSVLAHVITIKVVEEPAPAEAAAVPVAEATPAEPEVIKKGKKEEEGAEAKPEAKGEAKPKKK